MTGQPVASTTIAGVVRAPAVHCCRSTLVTAADVPLLVTVVVRTCSIPEIVAAGAAVYEHPEAAELSTSKRTTYLVVTVAAWSEAANRSSNSKCAAPRSTLVGFIDLSGMVLARSG